MDKNYLREIADYISEDKQLTNTFKHAIDCLDDEESFECEMDNDYNEDPEGFIEHILGSLEIVIDPKTKLDVGEDRTKIKALGKVYTEPLSFTVYEIFDDMCTEDNFFYEENGTLYINDDYEDGHIADAISDETGYLVYSVLYYIR